MYREQSKEDLINRIKDLEEELEELKRPKIDHYSVERMSRLAGKNILADAIRDAKRLKQEAMDDAQKYLDSRSAPLFKLGF